MCVQEFPLTMIRPLKICRTHEAIIALFLQLIVTLLPCSRDVALPQWLQKHLVGIKLFWTISTNISSSIHLAGRCVQIKLFNSLVLTLPLSASNKLQKCVVGLQEVSVKGQDCVYKDVIEPLESVSINIIETNKTDIKEFGNPEEVWFYHNDTYTRICVQY